MICKTNGLKRIWPISTRAPVSASDGWETYAADHLALLDHLGVRRANVMGGCIGSSYSLGVIEAAPEKLPLKQEIFGRLEKTTKRDCILASNTSALPITRIGEKVATADRVVGTHFWNPPHLIPLVEVVQAERTALPTVEKTIAMLAACGKSPVHVKRDVPGFIGNRLQHAMKREAIAIVAAGICDAETLDVVVKDGFGARLGILGPMEQSDLIGVNITLDVQRTMCPALDRSTEPSPLLVEMVEKGELGMSTGKGFYTWTPETAAAVRKRVNDQLVALARARAKARRGQA